MHTRPSVPPRAQTLVLILTYLTHSPIYTHPLSTLHRSVNAVYSRIEGHTERLRALALSTLEPRDWALESYTLSVLQPPPLYGIVVFCWLFCVGSVRSRPSSAPLCVAPQFHEILFVLSVRTPAHPPHPLLFPPATPTPRLTLPTTSRCGLRRMWTILSFVDRYRAQG
jgi:hypothetical protein